MHFVPLPQLRLCIDARELEQKRIGAACCALRAANVPAVSMSHSLQSLDHLGAVLQALSQGAAGGPRLCSLNLRGNWFKVEGAKMVAAALQGPLSGIWGAFNVRARAFVALTRGAAAGGTWRACSFTCSREM